MFSKSLSKLTVLALTLLVTISCRQQDNFYSNIMRSDVFYQMYDDHKYDFLWVFDNSGSMKSRRDFVKDNMQTFLNILNSRKAIDFQMAVATTDVFTDNGKLVSANGVEVVKSKQSANPVADFAALVNAVVDSPTSFWEQGLEGAYQAIYQHRAKFSRPGVPLVVIIVTDEEDFSCKEDCWGVEPENNTNWKPFEVVRYTEFFKNVKKAENTDLHLFPIVATDTTTCTVASVGQRYMDVAATLTELSTSGSICNSELRTSYEKIAKLIADRGVRFKLSSEAQGTGINIFVDGVLVPYSPENYVYEPETNSVVFTGAIPKKGAIVEVTYDQKHD